MAVLPPRRRTEPSAREARDPVDDGGEAEDDEGDADGGTHGAIVPTVPESERRARWRCSGRRGGAPGVQMGSRVGGGGMLAMSEPERAAVERARALRSEGKSLREIAATLAVDGFRPRGRRWHIATISRVVASATSPAAASPRWTLHPTASR